MKKAIGIGIAVIMVACVAGFSFAEVREYLQVARNRAASAVRSAIPLDVEIDRMQVLLDKLDAQVSHQKYAVAKTQIALQDAEAEHNRATARRDTLLAEMRHLRTLNPTEQGGHIPVGCHAVSETDVQRALSFKLSAYKEASATCDARCKAIELQRNAYAQLEEQFHQWQSQRRLLSQRIETLRARLLTQQLASNTNTTIINNADLTRASELADEIERELRVVEAQQALGTDPGSSLLTSNGTSGFANIEAEVDAVLNAN